MSYAKRLQAAMDAAGMSRKQLIAQAKISSSQLSLYLSGDSHPRPDAAHRICDALGVPPEALHDVAPKKNDTSDRNVPVETAAKMLGIGPLALRKALQEGVVDFGFAVKGAGDSYVYHISPKRLTEYAGPIPK